MSRILSFIFFVLVQQVYSQDDDQSSIRLLLDKQVLDWNSGDLEGYMEGYIKSDSLQFIGRNGIQYGWNRTLTNYRKSYPDKKSMGALSFVILRTDICQQTAIVTGEWHLKREAGNLKGYFTLVLKKLPDKGWKIISDHSS